MFIQTEATPNPQVLKFLPGRKILEGGSREFATPTEGAASPLAHALFAIDGVTRVYFGDDFLTVTKDADRDWSHLKAPILAEIMDHFTSGAALIDDAEAEVDEEVYEGETAQVVAEIKAATSCSPASNRTPASSGSTCAAPAPAARRRPPR